jgi:3,2-trans-enoyl-CoA isomerase
MKGFKIGLNETQLGIAMPVVAIEVTKNIISARHTEMALTQGTIFNAEEALKIGLIDEIASDKNEAVEKSLKFLNRYKNIPKDARALTKLAFRKKVLDLLNADREKDIENFVNFAKSEATQKTLVAFLNSSKK